MLSIRFFLKPGQHAAVLKPFNPKRISLRLYSTEDAVFGSRTTSRKQQAPTKRGAGATPTQGRARINRIRNKVADRRKKAWEHKQLNQIETKEEIFESRAGMPDSEAYKARQAVFDQYVTVFGRKTVRDALRDPDIQFKHIHIDERLVTMNSNVKRIEADPVILEILDLIKTRRIPLIEVDRVKVGIISKAGRQDGGIVADLIPAPGSKFLTVNDFLNHRARLISSESTPKGYRILALDQITTPTNMGMILRSVVAAGTFDAVLLAPGTVPHTNPLVIKASAATSLIPTKYSLDGTNKPIIIHTKAPLHEALQMLKSDGAEVSLLQALKGVPKNWSTKYDTPSSNQSVSLWDFTPPNKSVVVIGGESSGADPLVSEACTSRIHIPMNEAVESLNCAVAASLVAYAPGFRSML